MSVFEVSSPMYDPRSPRCRACMYFGSGERFEVAAECSCEGNRSGLGKIRRRWREHGDQACSWFSVASWVREKREPAATYPGENVEDRRPEGFGESGGSQ